jgi:Ala-tRNA(Pro) deacylase
VAGDKTVDLKKLKQTIGSSRLSFASEERLMKHLKVTKGSVSPMGILNDDDLAVEVFIDEALKDSTCIGVHPNDNTATVWISCRDLEQVIRCHGNPFSYIPI